MKKLFTNFSQLVVLLLIASMPLLVSAQTTYYWVGGSLVASFGSNSNWNTLQNGLGSSRSVAGPQTTDVLIVDGTNIGGTTPTTGVVTATISSNTIGQLRIQGGANVVFQRAAAAGGSGTLTIAGDGTAAPDFVVAAGCTLTSNSPLVDGTVNIALDVAATGLVDGTITFSNTGEHRITSLTPEGLVFSSGSTFNSNGTPASGYPFGSSTQGAQYGVVFQSGANLVFNGTRSPMGGLSTFQACLMKEGSNYFVRTSNNNLNGSFCNLKIFGNLIIQNNATLTADGPLYRVQNFTIEPGCTFITHTSGSTPVIGDLIVDGTFRGPVGGSSNQLVMGGTSQTISGNGTINPPTLVIANYSEVTLLSNVIVASSCEVYGKVTFGGGSKISGPGTFTSRVFNTAATVTGNIVAGSYLVTGIVGTISGNTGLAIVGNGLSPNTSVIAASSGGLQFILSKPALTTANGVTFNFNSDSATIVYSNATGMDPINGNVTVVGSRSYQSGTNYEINGPTNWPFGINSSSSSTSVGLGNVTLNASITTNFNIRVRGVLTLNTGIVTIRPTDTLRIVSGKDIAGAPFSLSKYILTSRSGSSVGVLRFENFASNKLFPIGTETNYLPVSLTPTSLMNYAASVFEGVTSEGTPSGTPFSAGQKENIVDATWIVNRTSGTGNCDATVNWTSVLEGSSFSGFADSDIGVSKHDGTTWGVAIGSGNNTINSATITDTSFNSISVGKLGDILPLEFMSITASARTSGVEINWSVVGENSVRRYEVEKSTNNINFFSVGTVEAVGKRNYSILDAGDLNKTTYYRIKMVGLNGQIKYSRIILVKVNSSSEVSVYPNPVSNNLFISGLKGTSDIRMVNAKGEAVRQIKTTANSISIDIAKLTSGFYLITILGENGSVKTKSFIKE